MPSQTIMLILMESMKCLIGIWIGLILVKITILLENKSQGRPANGTQLKYIKGHAQWLAGLSLAVIVGLSVLIWMGIEFTQWKKNYTRLWEWKGRVESILHVQ